MKIFHHNDNDGYCSAYWVLKKAKTTEEIQLYEMDYEKEFPFDEIEKDEEIYIVDYSILPEDMSKLLEITPNVTWIDHHQSAIKRYNDFPADIRGIRYDGIAACLLTWCYLTHMTDGGTGDIKEFNPSMGSNAPMFTKLIADYDVWTFLYGETTKEFQIGLSVEDRNPTSELWDDLYDDWNEEYLSDICDDGEVMLKYRDNFAKEYCDSKSYQCKFEGYNCLCLNIGLGGSEYFENVDNEYDMYILYSFNGKNWNYSLRSDTVNVADVAMKYGGGGHPGAAGFVSDMLLLIP